MVEKTYDELKTQFNSIYPNIPLNERKNCIAVIDDEPISWHIVKLEISGNTAIGKRCLEQMQTIKILGDLK